MEEASRLAGGEGAVALHVGLHAAVSLVGSLEGEDSQPVAQGEAPSIARQLQAVARPGEVLMTSAVRDKARTRFEIEPRPTPAGGAQATLHGRALSVFALRGALSATSATAELSSTSGGAEDEVDAVPPLVGRSAEVARLQSLVSMSACQGITGQAVILTGGAGHGKSAIVRNVLRTVREDASLNALVLVAQVTASYRPLPTASHRCSTDHFELALCGTRLTRCSRWPSCARVPPRWRSRCATARRDSVPPSGHCHVRSNP